MFQKFDSIRHDFFLSFLRYNNAEIIPFRWLFRVAFQRANVSKQSSPFFHSPDVITPALFLPEESQGTSFPFDPDRIRSPITRFPMLIFRPWRRKEVPEEPKVLCRRYRREIALWGLARALINDACPSPFPPHCSIIPSSFHRDESLVTTPPSRNFPYRGRGVVFISARITWKFTQILVEIRGSIKMDTRWLLVILVARVREKLINSKLLKKINGVTCFIYVSSNEERNDTRSWSFDENNTTRLICISRVNAYTHTSFPGCCVEEGGRRSRTTTR